MATRHDQNVSLEDRRTIEESDRDVVPQDLPNDRPIIHRIAERTWNFDHDCILPSREDVHMNTPRIAPVTDPSNEVERAMQEASSPARSHYPPSLARRGLQLLALPSSLVRPEPTIEELR
jgi:hypothetical protein